jgi:hypothetical protein
MHATTKTEMAATERGSRWTGGRAGSVMVEPQRCPSGPMRVRGQAAIWMRRG